MPLLGRALIIIVGSIDMLPESALPRRRQCRLLLVNPLIKIFSILYEPVPIGLVVPHVVTQKEVVQLLERSLKLVRAAKAFDRAAAQSGAELLELSPAQVRGS